MPKTGEVREDGYIWYQKRWNSPESLENIKQKDAEYKKKNKQKRLEYSNKYYEETKIYEKKKDYYINKAIAYQKSTNPFYGFSETQRNFRDGSISPDQFINDLDERIARTKELVSARRDSDEGHGGDV